MQRIAIVILFFFIKSAFGQTCPSLIEPLNGATNVPVDVTINWNHVEGSTGYIISIGTFSGGDDILSTQVGTTFYKPPLGLPDDSQIFVTITLFFFNMPNIVCQSESFTTEDITAPPNCTTMSSPLNGASNVNVASNISWNYITGATGYFLTIGTTPFSGDILNNLDVGNTLQYNPIADFPPLTEIFIRIVPYNENGNLMSCTDESFVTGEVAALPNCSPIVYPIDGQTNVPLSPLIEWEESLGASAYRVYIGLSPLENDILNGGVFYTNSTFVLNFEPNSIYFIRIVPINSAGEAIDCNQTSFSTILGCGPYFDLTTGELTTLNPVINLPDEIGICSNNGGSLISSTDVADGFRWYFVDANQDEVLIGNDREVDITETGTYLYEAYNLIEDSGFEIECTSSKMFTVVYSELPRIESVDINETNLGFEVLIQVSGNGNYEYSIDGADGQYQDSNFFSNIPPDVRYIYVRDKNGCGFIEYEFFEPNIFPKFFTPNSDGFHDVWQYLYKSDHDFIIEALYIYDQYGKLVKQINPYGRGWNGIINGQRMPNSDYWYKAIASNGKVFMGHFSLKR
ncbi:MAG TPA: T9SS type B sorting domain-containing protein [Flavobacteriaceae bacterium]|nr:T9SS type B sorting domain-containing protein [Flavobacteriaceae bacterium]